MKAGKITPIEQRILDSTVVTLKFKIALYTLFDHFPVYVDERMQRLDNTYAVTRSRRAFEHQGNDKKIYEELVSSAKMYSIIKRHLEYEERLLADLRQNNPEVPYPSNKEIEKLTRVLKLLEGPSRVHTLLEIQPRWTARSDHYDDLYEEAVSLVARIQEADATLIRDNLSTSQSTADKIIHQMEAEGLIGGRRVLISVDSMLRREA